MSSKLCDEQQTLQCTGPKGPKLEKGVQSACISSTKETPANSGDADGFMVLNDLMNASLQPPANILVHQKSIDSNRSA